MRVRRVIRVIRIIRVISVIRVIRVFRLEAGLGKEAGDKKRLAGLDFEAFL